MYEQTGEWTNRWIDSFNYLLHSLIQKVCLSPADLLNLNPDLRVKGVVAVVVGMFHHP